ncbi:MAG: histidine kinase [Rhodospirillaceae bacterium]|jgi:CBS domain-containing protein|nr:histidine kinase [Rhodospirillaceae bacterium]
MRVAQLLKAKRSDIVSVAPETPINEVAATLAEQHIGAIVVLDQTGRLAGIISERDLVRGLHSHGDDVFDRSAADLMTHEVITCGPENSLRDVTALMDSHRIRHLPVTDAQGLVGIISMRDVVNNRLVELEIENETIRAQLADM